MTAEIFASMPVESMHTAALRALWYAMHGQWTAAHEEAQADSHADAAWVHAMLHREEGDQANAAYWYRRARRPVFQGSVAEEQQAALVHLVATTSDGVLLNSGQ